MSTAQLRGEPNGRWINLREVAGAPVRAFQDGLARAGFYPPGAARGVFDYRTQSAARLFQEYVRTIEAQADIGTPDGVVGPRTQAHLQRWAAARQTADWVGRAGHTSTPAFRYWSRVLSLYLGLNRRRPINRVIALVQSHTPLTDTLRLTDWRVEASVANLIGIRRQEWRSARVRQNDDLFVLLVSGVALTFFGSTDPSPASVEERLEEPYLVRGQHQYRFGWHKISEPDRSYRAFRPLGPGVLVCRDSTQDDAFTDEDLRGGLKANATINVHWSGAGTGNWSAGCQVISGSRYLDHRGALADCSAFASPGYKNLDTKTRGAYNMLLDGVTALAPASPPAGTPNLIYTLIYERDLEQLVPGDLTLAAMARRDVAGLDPSAVDVAALVTRLVRAG